MVKEYQERAIAIKKVYEAGMKAIEIAKLFSISPQNVNYWIHHPITYKKKRREKLTKNERNFIIKWAKNKPINIASAKRIQKRFNRLSKYQKENKLQKKVSISTINKILNKFISKPKKIRKVFLLTETQKKKRYEFLEFMKKKKITPSDIFFTDESIFNLSSLSGNCKIRISKKMQKNLKCGNEKAINLIARPVHKKVNGIMISGGICKKGLSHLIFHSGNVNTFSYKQVLDFYKEDINDFGVKFFQQDGARVHSSKMSRDKLYNLFGNNFIPTWENGNNMDDEAMPKWPPNSPDLSAIELIWSIVKEMINLFPPNNLEELKSSIKNIWYSIPAALCEKIIEHIGERWKLCLKHKGRRLDKELLRKIPSIDKEVKWKKKIQQ